MAKTNRRKLAWGKRQARVRSKVRGTSERPRLCVFRSLSNMYAQIIDDESGNTLVSASSLPQDLGDHEGHRGNVDTAKKVGAAVAAKAQAKGIKRVVFDRNGFLYHGRVKALAEAAREAGLDF